MDDVILDTTFDPGNEDGQLDGADWIIIPVGSEYRNGYSAVRV